MSAGRYEKILLAHGGGGQLTDELIRRHILPKLSNPALAELADAAKLDLGSGRVCFTTDSYVVKPLFFNGGDIGKLAVCGTVNDLAVAGAVPAALSLSFIIEEGLEFEILERILTSIAEAAKQNEVDIVTGDTKTVEAGSADGIFINTAGIGVRIEAVELGFDKISAGDKVVINGTIADHGLAIISRREGIAFESQINSDCAGLAGLICPLLRRLEGVKFMRDPTRGGLAAALNDIVRRTGLGVQINEVDIPVNPTVQTAADILGFDVLNIANEGKFIAVVSPASADEFLTACREHPLGRDASIIGQIVQNRAVPIVELITRIGGKRVVQMPYGRELPRIC